MPDKTRPLLILSLLVELIILALSFLMAETWAETFKLAARFSGRFSALLFFGAFFQYLQHLRSKQVMDLGFSLLRVFALAHLIHFGFLAANIVLNEIPIIPFRLAGGALAYLLIFAAAFKFPLWKKGWQLSYFLYVNLVVFLTYLARAQGKFEGAEPQTLHFMGLGISAAFSIAALFYFIRYRK